MKTKICSGCKKQKLLLMFGKHKQHKDGLQSRCKECKRIYDQKYYQIHKIKYINHIKKYGKTLVGCLSICFNQIKQRCNNPKNPAYKNYGGRGIKCLFKNTNEFINYIISELKIDPRGLTIDRIDNNGHYESGNIRFTTQAENNKNKKR